MKAVTTSRADNLLFAFFALFLFGSTFSIALAQASLALALATFLAMITFQKQNPFGGALRPVYISIGVYVLWMAISPLASSTPLKSFLMEREDWLFMVLPIGIYVLAQKRYRNTLIAVLAVGVVLVSIYGSIQHFTGVHWLRTNLPTINANGRYSAEGTFANHLTYGNYIATAVGFLLTWVLLGRGRAWDRVRSISLLAALTGMAATVLSYARTSAAALPVAALMAAGFRGRRWIIGAGGIVVVAVAVALLFVPGVAMRYQMALQKDFAGESEAARAHIWGKSIGIVMDNPVFGVGHGHFPEAYRLQNDTARGEKRVFPHAHNDLLTVAAVSGIPGGLLFVAMWCAIGWATIRAWRVTWKDPEGRRWVGAAVVGSVVFLLCSVTEATFFDEEVRQLLMFVWAAGLWPLGKGVIVGDLPAYKVDDRRPPKALDRPESTGVY